MEILTYVVQCNTVERLTSLPHLWMSISNILQNLESISGDIKTMFISLTIQ